MSSSDEPGAKPKRILRPLSSDQWRRARIQFETGPRELTHERIAGIFQTSVSAVHKRAADEKWSKQSEIVVQAKKQLKQATDDQLAIVTAEASKQIVKSLMDDLQPFIEREKRAHIQRAIKRSKRAMKRLDSVAEGFEVLDSKTGEVRTIKPGPKDEMNLATAEDKYDNIIRRNLGLDDTKSAQGAISLNILTNQAAIQVAPAAA